MRYEDETDILEDICHYKNKEICLVTQSKLEEEILDSLRRFDEFYINNSGHECLPPDFVSSNNSFMFDVMRINDSEKKKSNNPVMRREREIQRELQEAFQGTNIPQHALTNGLVINAMPQEDYDQAHNYPQYNKQFERVVRQHIKIIKGCKERHPGQKMGFLMASFEGKVVYPPNEDKGEIFGEATEVIEVKNGIIPDGEYTMSVKAQKSGMNVKALMIVEKGVLILKAGATIAPLTQKTPMSWMKIRSALNIENNILAEDLTCSSPSMAAAIVCGHNKNGWETWKNKNGEFIDVYRQEIKAED